MSKTVFDSLPNLHSVTYVDCLTPTYLSDAVISTDMLGQIVTINDAALELLGCPVRQAIDTPRSKDTGILHSQTRR
ncbi:MAG: PAS domain-containing protein [Nostocales cyanobacterium LE14-WE4]|nr:PAS domain-containing protein [Nostocales cyanobacterium LE14-WE4]